MKIVKADVYPLRIPKRTVFRVAYATRTACRSAYLRLETEEGLVGWGEAVPVGEVTGESRPEAYAALAEFVRAELVGRAIPGREALRLLLRQRLAGYPSARCAVDTALWDLRGQQAGQPLAGLLGDARRRIRASISLGIKGERETVAELRTHLEAGFTDLKLKIGLDRAADVARVKTVRAELGRDFRLLLDANQGYTAEEALQVAEALAGEGVELIEQPVKASDLEGLAEVTRHSPIPIAADEAVKGPESLVAVIRRQAAHMVNVKLQKCGGPSEAELLVRMAEAAGMGAMVGCMIESRLGITAGLSVALGLANVKYVD
ncbi:MAG: mandelate racemase/muconate lactonizing enzyme family protein, partial [Chitinophagales bacterium]